MATRTITTVAATAGTRRDVHYGRQVKDRDRERPHTGIDAECGSDRGRRGSVQAMIVVDQAVTCSKCLCREGEFRGRVWTFDR